MVVFLHFPKLKENHGNFEQENGQDVFKTLTGHESPTGAIKLAAELEGKVRRQAGGGSSTTKHMDWINKTQTAVDFM